MSSESDNRVKLIKLVEGMDPVEVQQILIYATGYEAGKLERQADLPANMQSSPTSDHSV